MNYEIIISDSFYEDVNKISEYIYEKTCSKKIVTDFYNRIYEAVSTLSFIPTCFKNIQKIIEGGL